MADGDVTTRLNFEVGPSGLDDLENRLERLAKLAEKIPASLAGGFGRGVPGGGGPSSSPGSSTNSRAGVAVGAGVGAGVGSRLGRGGGGGVGQLPMPNEGLVGRALGSLPLVGGIGVGTWLAMQQTYQAFENYQLARLQTAPFARPGGTGMGRRQGYLPEEALSFQRAVSAGAGFGINQGVMESTILPAMRGMGLEAGQLGAFLRPFAAGAGGTMTGQMDPAAVLREAIASGMATGFQKARLGEYLTGIAGIVTSQGRMFDTNVSETQQLAMRLHAAGGKWFAGPRGLQGVQALQQAGRGMLGPGGGMDPFRGIMLRRVGFGVGGQGYRESMLKLQRLVAKPTEFAKAVMDATRGMDQETRWIFLHQQLGGMLSPEQIDALLRGEQALGQEAMPAGVDLAEEEKAAMQFGGGAARHRRQIRVIRTRTGARAAPAVRRARVAGAEATGAMVEALAPAMGAIAETVGELAETTKKFSEIVQKEGLGKGIKFLTEEAAKAVGNMAKEAVEAIGNTIKELGKQTVEEFLEGKGPSRRAGSRAFEFYMPQDLGAAFSQQIATAGSPKEMFRRWKALDIMYTPMIELMAQSGREWQKGTGAPEGFEVLSPIGQTPEALEKMRAWVTRRRAEVQKEWVEAWKAGKQTRPGALTAYGLPMTKEVLEQRKKEQEEREKRHEEAERKYQEQKAERERKEREERKKKKAERQGQTASVGNVNIRVFGVTNQALWLRRRSDGVDIIPSQQVGMA